MKAFVKMTLMAAFCLSAMACNTVKGVGADVGAAGRGIEKAADKTEEAID